MKRSSMNLSFSHGLSLDMGYLVPIAAIDVLPGDTFRVAANVLARVAPMAKPIMHPVEIRIHNWFVPNRIIWDEWEEFIVGNEPGHTYPTITPANVSETVLYDHMGAEPVPSVDYDALPIRAYNLIWNEFYRDQDLSAERTSEQLDLARVAWAKDYFTAARANSQQGAGVEVGFSASAAPVLGLGAGSGSPSTVTGDIIQSDGTTYTGDMIQASVGVRHAVKGSNPNKMVDVYADLSQATGGIDINELRTAISLQRIAEAREFFGSRYVDYLRFYGINPRDGRLDRPEYLGGGRRRLSFSEVLSTAEGSNTEVGDMFGHGIGSLYQRPIRKMFEEHGWFISVMSIRPKSIYQNGIPKRFNRREPTDYWHRELELLPWQEVYMKEIFGSSPADQVFGYAPRYDEYREVSSYVSGTFRGGTEEDWTLSREFASAPTLNESFITCTPSDRIYLDTNMPEILADVGFKIAARRLVSQTGRISNRAGL